MDTRTDRQPGYGCHTIEHDLATAGRFGVDGKTPYIGENGHWWIGDRDTGVVAEIRPAAAWNPDRAYERLEVVENGGSSYMARQANQGVVPGTDSDVWMLLAQKGEAFTFEDFTQEQIALLQLPATEAAERAIQAATAAKEAADDAAFATQEAITATEAAQSAATEAAAAAESANAAAQVANTAATDARTAIRDTEAATEQADAATGSATQAATAANAAADDAVLATQEATTATEALQNAATEATAAAESANAAAQAANTAAANVKSAYDAAILGGFAGTEEEFNASIASIGQIDEVLDAINGEVI